MLAVILPHLRKNGMHYEVNIPDYPRFFVAWSPLERYDVTDASLKIPYDLVLAVSDAIEHRNKK